MAKQLDDMVNFNDTDRCKRETIFSRLYFTVIPFVKDYSKK